MNTGIALIALGLTIKGTVYAYRHIRNKRYIDPFKMYPGGFFPTMDRRQALLILGLDQRADPAMIKQKHRVLMRNNHPDNGGSTFLATKINQAKQFLVKQ